MPRALGVCKPLTMPCIAVLFPGPHVVGPHAFDSIDELHVTQTFEIDAIYMYLYAPNHAHLVLLCFNLLTTNILYILHTH